MDKRIIISLKFILVLAIFFVWQIQALASQKNSIIIASMEYQSWVDLGNKSIFFSDGTAYIFKPIQIDQAGKVELHPLKARIRQEQINDLVSAFNSNHFSEIPEELSKNVTDGNELYIYFANSGVYHRVKDYMVPNQSLNEINTQISKVSTTLSKTAAAVSIDQVLNDMRARLKTLPGDSPQYKCLSAFVSLLVGNLIGAQQVDFARYKDLSRPGVY